MKQIVSILFACVVGLQAFDIKCNFHSFDDFFISGLVCKATNVKITSRQTITSVNGHNNFDGSNCTTINIWNQVVHFIPEGLGKFFPNPERLAIKGSNLKRVEKKDLQQFPKLRFLDLNANKIEFLPGDLFEKNPEIRRFSVSYNQISHVGHNLLTPLKNLEIVYLKENKCIDDEFESDELEIASDLIARCPQPTKEMI
jgi:hypothetical protein